MPSGSDGHETVNERVRDLIEALRAAPAIGRFRAAEERFRTDPELSRLQAKLRESHERLRLAERERRHDSQLFEEIRDGQSRLQKHPLVVELLAARAEARELLRETNEAMSAVLGVDVGGSVGRAGGC